MLGMLCLEMLTPVVCVAIAIMAPIDLPNLRNGSGIELGITVVSLFAYALLGPGAYSIDAKLFGRRVLLSSDDSRSPKDE